MMNPEWLTGYTEAARTFSANGTFPMAMPTAAHCLGLWRETRGKVCYLDIVARCEGSMDAYLAAWGY